MKNKPKKYASNPKSYLQKQNPIRHSDISAKKIQISATKKNVVHLYVCVLQYFKKIPALSFNLVRKKKKFTKPSHRIWVTSPSGR